MYGHAEEDQGRFGTLAGITGRWAGDTYLPDWLEEGISSSLRDTEADVPAKPVYTAQSSAARSIASTSSKAGPVVLTPTGGVSPAGSVTRQETKAAYTDLDKFYEDTEDVEETEESESEESEDDEEGTESGEEEESSEEESEDDDEEDEGQHSGNHVQVTTG